jgi:archaellum component FlaC
MEEKDIDRIGNVFLNSFSTLFSNFSHWFGNTNNRLDELRISINSLNETIKEASKSSNRVAWALWGVTAAGVLIAAVQLFKK